MKNEKILDSTKLLSNLNNFQSKKVCAMVKANAYGHGMKEVVEILKKHVDYFGVSSVEEGVFVRELTDKPILVCSKVSDFDLCKKHQLEFFVDCEEDIENAVKFGLKKNCHLKINCGMNRYGFKSKLALVRVDNLLKKHKIKLKSICVHFSNTENRSQTQRQYQKFLVLKQNISQDAPICFGGSGVAKFDFDFDMIRVGIALYGYEDERCVPVMQIKSRVTKVFFVKKGEFVGYGRSYRAKSDEKIAIIPLGYADGALRSFSGKVDVEINGKKCLIVGNVCMDCMFVKSDDANVGDEVTVLGDAKIVAKKVGTISYEILTNFSKMRGKIYVM